MSKQDPHAWRVRAPYFIPYDGNEESEESKYTDGTNGGSTSSSRPRTKSTTVRVNSTTVRRIRPTRYVPADPTPFLRTETDREALLRREDDEPQRLFNNRNEAYFLPSDDAEFQRLEHQHNAFTVGLGGLYPCPEVVQDVLAPVEGVKKAVLDLGCGTGAWMLAMAQEFPHATFLGVDLIPCPHPTSDIPPNCMFEIDDINKGLEHFEGQFDLVHARCISFGISNYRKTMEEISLCLKPGGLAIFIEADLDLLAEDRTTILPIALTDKEIREAIARSEQKGLPLSEAEKASLGEGAWLQRITYEVVYSATLNGSDIPGAEEAVDEGLWRMNMFDPALCGASSVFTPVTPWPRMRDPEQSQKVKYAGSLMRQDAHNALRAFHPLLRKYGVSQSIIDQWTAAADWELTSQKFRCWTRLRVAWGRRKQRKERGSGHSTEPSPSPSPSSSGTKGQQFLLHQVEVYNSREEALSAKEARLSTRDPRPLPFVARLARGESIAL